VTETILPMPGRVLVRPDDDPKTLGRLLLPDSARRAARKGLTGTVHSVGEGCDLAVLPGDRVVYLWAGYDLKNCRLSSENAELVALKPESILARLEPDYLDYDKRFPVTGPSHTAADDPSDDPHYIELGGEGGA
jgi:co-chaperonin GroES (HSP10)